DRSPPGARVGSTVPSASSSARGGAIGDTERPGHDSPRTAGGRPWTGITRGSSSSTAARSARSFRDGSRRRRNRRRGASSGAPLLLELPPVLREESEITPLAEPAEGRHLPVMHEAVPRAADFVAGRAHAAV